ncbi:actin-histidine N-methyltransferase isoform X2 [Cylas formicarius]|uniref:actin-histidine N-methyltransferase isoform X2 n=1 Tax=Cylas formicarius TaxID=197179 RepID=UPI002958D1E8|nr:actin-histidine N-methyltransferase isoform X2 [Cylas formicarius]
MDPKLNGSKSAKKTPTWKQKNAKQEKQLLDSINELLIAIMPKKIGSPAPKNHEQVNALIERVKQLEDKAARGSCKSTVDRTSPEVLTKFMQWFSDNGGELNGCSISKFDGYDLGIKADTDVAESSLIISVPKRLVLSVENAHVNVLEELTRKMGPLGTMTNVLLAMYLLVEKYSAASFWKPYIDILPKAYTTVLYFSHDELQKLQGSPTQDMAFKLIQSVAKHYAILFKIFKNGDDPLTVLLRNRFCFRDYCWAVSTVMTRQNMIPTEDGSKTTNALIPLWDLCNHTAGIITTDYNPEMKRCECLALRDFKAGEQIFIFYGPRSNAEMFVHNGFVYDGNQYDTYRLNLGVSKNDPLRDKRKRLLSKLEIPEGTEFLLRWNEPPVDDTLMKFLAVFKMSEERLDASLDADVVDTEDAELRKKCWAYLETRLKLLLAACKKSLSQDNVSLGGKEISPHMRLAVQMRLSEMRLLEYAIEYASKFS